MSGIVYGGMALGVLLLLTVTRSIYMMVSAARDRLRPYGRAVVVLGRSVFGSTFCVASMINLVLLAENRLGLSTATGSPPCGSASSPSSS